MKLAHSLQMMAAMVALAPLGAALAEPAKPTADQALQAAVAGEWRSDEAKARDKYRHPAESLTFWGLEPGMTILEIQPGGASWWTDILAPYAKLTGGKFYATGADLANPKLSEGAKKRGRNSRLATCPSPTSMARSRSSTGVPFRRRCQPIPSTSS
jgi:predicted methyltransferase